MYICCISFESWIVYNRADFSEILCCIKCIWAPRILITNFVSLLFFPSVSPSNEDLFSSCFDSFVFDQMYLGAANSYCELCEFAFFCHPLRLQMRVSMAVVFGLFLLTKCVWAQRIHIANFVSVPFFPPIRFAFE